ncbi:MAG: type II toxin-antitoxin system Phd/YefM family antitoxin [Deltaproteobacteria bacterium]|nr:type II toxin-antitoxin system Phd/YefM family antitoxin [Deltaproteobacteria bacterium]MBI3294542.1 type II toxin-antitoxin system Phd/YefM family antitoxin [Deltaproteobacteria bacterium]
MKKTNALQLRQSMGKVMKDLLKTGEPILIEKGRTPVAVLITLEDYQKRFVDKDADVRRKEIVEKILASRLEAPPGQKSIDVIRDIRS